MTSANSESERTAMHHTPGPVTFEPIPLTDEDVVSGTPEAAAAVLWQAPDGAITGLFSCTQGAFRYAFASQESMHVLSGRVIVSPDGGDPVELVAGDTLVLPAGTAAVFDVRESLLDVYTSEAQR